MPTRIRNGFITTGNSRITGSLRVTAGVTASFTGSYTGDGAGLYNIPAGGIVGLNLSQISSGSVSASISPTQFTVASASITEFTVTGTGVTLGSVITDTHRVTGSLNVSGSVTATSFIGDGSGLTGIITERRSDYTGSVDPNINLLYLGEAENGSAESATVWTISQLSVSSSGATVTRSTSSAAWTDRYTYTYL